MSEVVCHCIVSWFPVSYPTVFQSSASPSTSLLAVSVPADRQEGPGTDFVEFAFIPRFGFVIQARIRNRNLHKGQWIECNLHEEGRTGKTFSAIGWLAAPIED